MDFEQLLPIMWALIIRGLDHFADNKGVNLWLTIAR